MQMLRILEISWLIIAILSVAMGTYKCITHGFDEAIFIFLISVVAVAFYFVRRKQRISMEKQQGNKNISA